MQLITKYLPEILFVLGLLMLVVKYTDVKNQRTSNNVREQHQEEREVRKEKKLNDIHEGLTKRDASRDALIRDKEAQLLLSAKEVERENHIDGKSIIERATKRAAQEMQKESDEERRKKEQEKLQKEIETFKKQESVENKQELNQQANILQKRVLYEYELIKADVGKDLLDRVDDVFKDAVDGNIGEVWFYKDSAYINLGGPHLVSNLDGSIIINFGGKRDGPFILGDKMQEKSMILAIRKNLEWITELRLSHYLKQK